MTSSHSSDSTASNGTKIAKATGQTQTAKSGHGSAMTAFKSFVSRSCQRGQKPLTIPCHKTWTGFHGYADRKFNKHDPDSLYGDIGNFLNSASLQGALPATPLSLSHCSFIQHDSEASAQKEVTRNHGILKGYHWYPDTIHHQERSVLKTQSGTIDPSQSASPPTEGNQDDMSNHPYGIFGDLNRQEVMGLRSPKSIVPNGISDPSSSQSS